MSDVEGKAGAPHGDAESIRARFENERMTRRQALRKFGFMAGMAAFATVSVDDLARIASKKLQENEATKGIGDTLAKEFRAAGVALATPDGGNPYGGVVPGGGTPYNGYYAALLPADRVCAGRIDCEGCCNDHRAARDRACGRNELCLGRSGIDYQSCVRSCPIV